MKATLTFPNLKMAKQFASAWARTTLQGNDMSPVKNDGSVDVTVYNVSENRKKWIDDYVESINKD